ncbi:isochorismatase family protein [Pseudoclavibacter sp. CFCC 13796]|uniref:isochorismatase family protein n=1 Tax=Pseudoclavibacter sp. CFCC 13796 TaxID=2615179 RepID=UPI00130122F6|nr:isochorismatase family protein [Pseudoclavibacter sp. CFCC 13796]KAB1659953.1 isochorismatase family protein [Pseudoclavibacter sp. CFCC 13796]
MLDAIVDYVPPCPTELPSNRVSWSIDPSRAMLLVHDMQQHFLSSYPPESTALNTAVDNIVRLRDIAVAHGVPVVYSAQPPAQDAQRRALLTDFWGPGLQTDDEARLIDSLGPVDESQIMTKWRYDAFERTDLTDRLQRAGRDQLIVVGVYAHIGCLATALSAFMKDVQPFLIGDALADFSAAHHQQALAYAAERCARVVDADTAAAELSCGAE